MRNHHERPTFSMVHRWRSSLVVLLIWTFCVSMTGCGILDSRGQTWGPLEPYEHEPMDETSMATPVSADGEVGALAAALERSGFFCAQVRSNSLARQIWCRAAVPPVATGDDPRVTTVDLVSTLDGQLQYAYFDLPKSVSPRPPSDPDQAQRLLTILEASVLKLWPEDASAIRAIVDDVQKPPWLSVKDPSDPRPPSRASVTTDHARYNVGEGRFFGDGITVHGDPVLTFTLMTDALMDHAWPFSGAHYATTTTAAAPGLEEGGFDCYGPQESPCTRPAGNQQVDYMTQGRTNQILTASVGISGGIKTPGEGLSSLASTGFPNGLTFLTPKVRAGVEKQLTHARLTGESFIGIIEGTVVILETRSTRPQPDGTYAVRVQLSVGVPLVTVPGS